MRESVNIYGHFQATADSVKVSNSTLKPKLIETFKNPLPTSQKTLTLRLKDQTINAVRDVVTALVRIFRCL